MLPARFKFCRLSQLCKGSGCAKQKTCVWTTQTNTAQLIELMCIESLPKLEILLADKLSTERWRRDDRAAKLVILFPVRSSLSRFMHSPMQPRSCIPARDVINYSTWRRQNSGMSANPYLGLAIWGTVWIPSQTPQLETWAAQRLLCHSLRLEDSGIKGEQSGADFLSLWSKSELIIRKSAPQKHKMPQALSVLFVEVIQ